MSIVNNLSLESNRQININFDGGDLSSDAGLLLLKEFAAKIGFIKLIKSKFKTLKHLISERLNGHQNTVTFW